MTAPPAAIPQSLLPKAERRRRERAMLNTLQDVADDAKASAAARVRAAKAILEHLKPMKVVVPRRAGKGRLSAPARTPEELREALAELQARRERLQ